MTVKVLNTESVFLPLKQYSANSQLGSVVVELNLNMTIIDRQLVRSSFNVLSYTLF